MMYFDTVIYMKYLMIIILLYIYICVTYVLCSTENVSMNKQSFSCIESVVNALYTVEPVLGDP